MRAWNFGRGKGATNKFNYKLTCEWCGVTFAAKRPDATTCKPSHRSQWSRWCRAFKQQTGNEALKGPRGDLSKQNKFKQRKGWSK